MAQKSTKLPNGLTENQEEFCNQYLIDLDAYHACIRAGYSKKTAKNAAYKMMRNDKIVDRIMELKKARLRRMHLSQDEVLAQWFEIGTFDIRELYHADGRMRLPHELSAAAGQVVAAAKVRQVSKRTNHLEGDEGDEVVETRVEEVVEYKLNDKHTALTNAARHMGMMKEADASDAAKSIIDVLDSLKPTVGPTSELESVPASAKH